jgi:HAD superfamily hydrolase (TIGR01450 family)
LKFIQPYQLIDRYDALLLDAYGVLVDKTGPLPGACDFVDRLNSTSKPYYLLTNSASRLPETMAEEFAAIGLHIPAQRIITSGMLLRNWVWRHDLVGQTAAMLGTKDSLRYAEQAGLRTVAGGKLEKLLAEKGKPPAALVVADQAGFDLIPAMNAVLSMLFRQLDSGQDLHLVLCNPDLVYPRAPGQFGFTAGALAAMLEAILRERYGDGAPTFERLGKPHPPLFEEAIRQAGSRRVLMVGDQLATDIVGANRCGIDSVLVDTGLAPAAGNTTEQKPTWRMSSLMIDFDP